MSELRTTWLRLSVTIIASVYGIYGLASALQSVYALLIAGSRQTTPGLLESLIPLFIAFGLITLRPWARILTLVISGFLIFVGIVSLVLCVAYAFGFLTPGAGLIVDRPGLAVAWPIALIAFAGWQWWVLSRPSIQAMFCASAKWP
jgi:hypothetical protein